MLKSEKGMTLVSLVIAIVVLLALAGTVVYLVFGKNGAAQNIPVVVQSQDRNYVKSIVTVGLKAVRAQVSSAPVNSTETVTVSNADKMSALMLFLDESEFTKESDTVLTYKSNGITFKITVDFDEYKIIDIE